jgi:DNA polymerase III epsilon subunit-like protein
VLEERHDELSDPVEVPEVVALAERLEAARASGAPISLPPMNGVEIPLRAILAALGHHDVGVAPHDATFSASDAPQLGLPLALFKSGQLLESRSGMRAFRDFVAFDLETTTNDCDAAEIVEIAAVRVRDGRPVETFSALVRPRGPISRAASDVHGIRDSDVATASPFEDVWPQFRRFCGDDVVVAHNGFSFDFRILKRLVRAMDAPYELCTYDTLLLARDLYPASRRLPDLARTFGIDTGRSHRALPDARTLAQVVLKLDDAKMARARKSALIQQLGHLGVALALCDEASLCAEAQLFRQFSRAYALGRYGGCIEHYEAEVGDNESVPSVDELIDRLGGAKLMLRIRADKTADDLYPAAMPRLRRLVDEIAHGTLEAQIEAFLERAVLSRYDGVEPERGRVNLLTLHSTKGLEFSRVYIVGAEDGQIPGGTPSKPATKDEVEESRRLLYVGMTRAKERVVLTRVERRAGKPTFGHRFLDEMGLVPTRTG